MEFHRIRRKNQSEQIHTNPHKSTQIHTNPHKSAQIHTNPHKLIILRNHQPWMNKLKKQKVSKARQYQSPKKRLLLSLSIILLPKFNSMINLRMICHIVIHHSTFWENLKILQLNIEIGRRPLMVSDLCSSNQLMHLVRSSRDASIILKSHLKKMNLPRFNPQPKNKN